MTQTVTDARGAKSTFSHNGRHQLTNIAYDLSQAPGVSSTANVSYSYDAAGNRTSMNDGLGSTTYAYDQLSRMSSETRNLTGVGSYTLNYTYNLAGELTNLTNPWGAQVGYVYDKAGRLTSVTGAGYAGVSSYAGALAYRASGGLKAMTYGNSRTLSVSYDNRLRPTSWNVANVQGYNYNYDYLNEHTGRVTYAQNINDGTLDRSAEYDHLGRLTFVHSGAEARAHAYSGQWGTMDGPYSLGFEYDKWGNLTHRYGWGGEVQGGTAGQTSHLYSTYNSNNRRIGFSYDASGNLTNDLGQTFTYDATGQQATASYGGYLLQQSYDGDRVRVRKSENGDTAYYLRSSVLGGQVVAEIKDWGSGWGWWRGYVYAGNTMLAIQKDGVNWVHEDPITKNKRVTNISGTVVSAIELDPWGADTNRSSNAAFQPRKFTSYDRDGNGTDEAMFRRYNRWHSRFDQPDPYDGAYDFSNPQSFNRYAYVQNDPVNFIDPTGLLPSDGQCQGAECPWGGGGGGFWGAGYSGGNGWGSDPRPGLSIIGSTFHSDIRQTFRIWDPELFDNTGGRRGGELVPSSTLLTFGFSFEWRVGRGWIRRQQPQNPPVKPNCIPNGTGEVGIEAILPVFVGPKGGFQVDSRGIYPTWGISAGTPGKGVSVTGTASKAMVSPGLSFGFSINVILGFSFQTGPISHAQPSFRQAIRNGSFQFGGGTPGASVSATVVHDTPRFIKNVWPCQ